MSVSSRTNIRRDSRIDAFSNGANVSRIGRPATAAVRAEPATPTREEVFAALVELGGTAPAVAATLDAGQHFGDRGCCHSCPLVNYLWARFPGCTRIEVGAVHALVWVAGDHREQATFLVDLPDPVLQFRMEFDHGGHDALNAAAVTG